MYLNTGINIGSFKIKISGTLFEVFVQNLAPFYLINNFIKYIKKFNKPFVEGQISLNMVKINLYLFCI